MGTSEPSVRICSGALSSVVFTFTKVAIYIAECQRVLQKSDLVFKVCSFTRARLQSNQQGRCSKHQSIAAQHMSTLHTPSGYGTNIGERYSSARFFDLQPLQKDHGLK